MKMQEIRAIAKQHGIKTGNLSKVKLVRSIQVNEGNFDCFATPAIESCGQMGCLWREDCTELAAKSSSVS